MRRRALLDKIAEATHCGVDLIQLREKDLAARELESLCRDAVRVVHARDAGNPESRTRLLVNSRTDVALACNADGVHLPSDDISPSLARTIWAQARPGADAIVSITCHSVADVARAASEGANFAVFAPVFEKMNAPHPRAAGLGALREACRQEVPILALGGITLKNARACLDAGAVGIAAIRLFQENNIAEVVRQLRG